MRAFLHLGVIIGVAVAMASLASGAAGAASDADDIPSKPVTSAIDRGDDPVVELAPARLDDITLDPGGQLRLALEVRNRTDFAVSLKPTVIALVGSTDPGSLASPAADDSRRSEAVEWVRMPFERWPSLEPGTALRFPVTIQVPDDARPGLHALGLGVQRQVTGASIGGVDTNDAHVRVTADLLSELLLTVSGDARARVRVKNVDGPRFVRSGHPAEFRATAANDGDTLLHIDSQVELGAFLSTASQTIPMQGPKDGYPTLPRGVRELRLRWSDPPLVGWFTPTLVVVGGEGSGVRVTRQLDTVFVLPPWWLVLLVVFAIWLPVRAWRRRRRVRHATGADRELARSRVEQRLRKRDAKQRARDARRQPPRR